MSKLMDPEFEIPTNPTPDPHNVVEKAEGDTVSAEALGFLVEHCKGYGFSHSEVRLGTTMPKLVALLGRDYSKDRGAQRIQYSCRVMLCILAQAFEDGCSVPFEEFGVSLDKVWELFPYPIESREAPLAKLKSKHLLSLLRSFAKINDDLTRGGGYDTWSHFEHSWESFVVKFRASIWDQMKVRLVELNEMRVGDLSSGDQKLMEIVNGNKKNFGLSRYD
jgi:hypothetical protein